MQISLYQSSTIGGLTGPVVQTRVRAVLYKSFISMAWNRHLRNKVYAWMVLFFAFFAATMYYWIQVLPQIINDFWPAGVVPTYAMVLVVVMAVFGIVMSGLCMVELYRAASDWNSAIMRFNLENRDTAVEL